jgi:hypothetical protein
VINSKSPPRDFPADPRARAIDAVHHESLTPLKKSSGYVL